MSRSSRSLLFIFCALAVGVSVWAETRTPKTQESPTAGSTANAPSSTTPIQTKGHDEQDLKRLWDQAKTFLKQGSYDDARQSLEAILAITPNDSWAQLYHKLCEERLRSARPFAQFSPAQLQSLKARLKEEERTRQRTAGQRKTAEKLVQQEQARWDRELEVLQRQANWEEARNRKTAQAEAVKKARAERVQVRELAKQQAVQAAGGTTPTTTTPVAPSVAAPQGEVAEQAGGAGVEQGRTSVSQPETPSATATTAEAERKTAAVSEEYRLTTAPTAETPSVSPAETTLSTAPSTPPIGGGKTAPEHPIELLPVVVPAPPPETTAHGEPISPSLVGRTVPIKGAVQINARQMSVSPDRRIAIADGDVEVVFENAVVTCDHLTLFTDTKDVYAEGRVRIEEGEQVFRGEMVHYNFETKKGRFLQGTVSSPPWHEHGRSVEHIAEGVYEVTPGYLTTCDEEPPHFKLAGHRATVFADDRTARMSNVSLVVDQLPFLYLPYMSLSDRQSPFFIAPGKKKPWGPFALMGYRYELPGPLKQRGTIHLDWRRYFLWGMGLDHQFDSPQTGRGLLKLYYNEEQNLLVQDPKANLPKGATQNRYRILFRHRWSPLPDTTVITDIQKYSDRDYRKDFLFREEFVNDDTPESFISVVKSAPEFTLTGLVRKRINRFQGVTQALPQLTVEARQQRIGDTQFFSSSSLSFSNFVAKSGNRESDTDGVVLSWVPRLSYALNLFNPIMITPRVGMNQTYYHKDIRTAGHQGQQHVIGGQFFTGADASLTLFRIFPIITNFLGLDLHYLRHVLAPSLSYDYVHLPTIPNEQLDFPAAAAYNNKLTFGVENKLQTKRADPAAPGRLHTVDLGRLLIQVPYSFRGVTNKQGGRLGDWSFDLETYPWPWMRLESDWIYPSHFVKGSRNGRIPGWNIDLVMVGGWEEANAKGAPYIRHPAPRLIETPEMVAPKIRGFQPGPRKEDVELMPLGRWYLGLGHRFSAQDKTESVLEFDWRLSQKWQIGTFHRFTWKEVASGQKRFGNLRETQYILRRDLHDWIAEVVYHVDREFGEELYFTMTLKAYPNLPISTSDSYHQPKAGSQSSPFSPIRVQSP